MRVSEQVASPIGGLLDKFFRTSSRKHLFVEHSNLPQPVKKRNVPEEARQSSNPFKSCSPYLRISPVFQVHAFMIFMFTGHHWTA